jgi:NodT family efflux transporter outer membrane factor (OMF) lipoprotein
LLLNACALHTQPQDTAIEQEALSQVRIPAHWQAGANGAEVPDQNWLRLFASPQLDALAAEALQNSPDMRLTAARIAEAAAALKQLEGSIYPSVQLLAHGGGKLGGDNSGLRGVVLSSSWEIDVWGRMRYGIRAGESQYLATLEDRHFARQSLVASVAKAWLLAIEARQQTTLAQDDLQAARQLSRLAQLRLRIGSGSETEWQQAQSEADAAQQQTLVLQLRQAQSQQALDLLLGRYPGQPMTLQTALPAMPGPVPAGLPSELLERRPDVIAATLRVTEAFNRSEAARAALLPHFSLTLAFASLSSSLVSLSNQDNPFWSGGASMLAPLFQGGTLRAQVEARNAEQQAALANYAQTGLNAFQEVEFALTADHSLSLQQQQQQARRDASAQQLTIARSSQRIGASDQSALLRQQRLTLAEEAALLQLQRQRLCQRVNLYLALGGGYAE